MGEFYNQKLFRDLIGKYSIKELSSTNADVLYEYISNDFNFEKLFEAEDPIETEEDNERQKLLETLSTKTTEQLRMVVYVLEQLENENNK